MEPREYRKELTALGLDRMKVRAADAASAREQLSRVRDLMKRLDEMRAGLDQDVLRTRAEFVRDRKTASNSTIWGRLGLAGKFGLGRDAERRRIAVDRSEREAMAEYEEVGAAIDSVQGQLDEAEARLQAFLQKRGAGVHYQVARPGSPSVRQGPEPGAPRCRHCGARLEVKRTFCPGCGAKVI